MYSRSSLLVGILAVGLVTGLGIAPKLKASKLKLPFNRKLNSLQQQTEILAATEPQLSQACFAYYSPIVDAIMGQYEFEYNQCNTSYNSSSTNIVSAWNSTLWAIQASGDQGCNVFTDCSTIVNNKQAFECYANEGASQSKVLYQVSADAVNATAYLKISLQELTGQLDSCVNSAQVAYVQDTSSTYEQLNACLKGAAIPTTTPDATSTTGVDYDTTTPY
ncbi:hypothetical protein KR018_005309 [Drosophila ironensis]|nr:hypothetical protein KR018_005309 [Drosophila ironensis]